MNLINSVTSGMNINFGSNGFFGGQNNVNNINIEGNYEEDDGDDDDDDDEEDEENEEEDMEEEEEEEVEDNDSNNEIELFIKKRNQYILELDEFQFKHLKKYTALKEDKCPICLQKYKGPDIIKEFPCKHIFHKNCIFKWLKKSNKCPLCKYDITNDVNKVTLKYDDDDC